MIPCWNAGPHLEPLLRSLLGQTWPRFELILVDDGSTDGSADVAARVAGERIEIVRYADSVGIGANWNRAVSASVGEFVCIAHQDDVYEPWYLETMVAALEANPAAGYAHGRAVAIDGVGARIASAVESYKQAFFDSTDSERGAGGEYQLLMQGNWINCPSILYRRKALDSVGGFDPNLEFTLDWSLTFRLLLAGWQLVPIDRPVIRYRRHRTSASKAAVRSLRRYREEVDLLTWAFEQGVHAGYLPSQATPTFVPVRNNLLFDAYVDLRYGRVDLAREKLRFGRSAVPGFERDLLARVVTACVSLGVVGAGLLRVGLGLWLALARLRRA